MWVFRGTWCMGLQGDLVGESSGGPLVYGSSGGPSCMCLQGDFVGVVFKGTWCMGLQGDLVYGSSGGPRGWVYKGTLCVWVF